MIAENVNVSLFGSISEGLYSARIGTGSVSNKSAYVVTRKKIKEYFDGVVVAVAEFEGLDGERPIVSTYGEVFYEPELRKILSRLRNIKLKSIRCLYEKSCGGIIFYKTRQNTKILLVKNNNGRYWSFPKGHIEEGETPRDQGGNGTGRYSRSGLPRNQRVQSLRQDTQARCILPRASLHRQREDSGGGDRQLHLGRSAAGAQALLLRQRPSHNRKG